VSTHPNSRTNENRAGTTYRKTVDVNDFLTLQRTGATAAVIAERLGVTPRTVVRLRSRHGVAQPYARHAPVNDEWKARVKDLLDDGASISDVCRTLDTTHDTVKRYFPDAGWTKTMASHYARAVRTANETLRRNGHEPFKNLDHK